MVDTDNDNLLTVAEVADLWGTSKHSVYRAIRVGDLPAVRVRGRNRYLVYQSGAELARDGMPVLVEPAVKPEYLTVAEVAARLACSNETIRRLVNSGDLEALRFSGKGSRLRIAPEAVDAYISRNRATLTATAAHA